MYGTQASSIFPTSIGATRCNAIALCMSMCLWRLCITCINSSCPLFFFLILHSRRLVIVFFLLSQSCNTKSLITLPTVEALHYGIPICHSIVVYVIDLSTYYSQASDFSGSSHHIRAALTARLWVRTTPSGVTRKSSVLGAERHGDSEPVP